MQPPHIKKILLTKSDIEKKVCELAQQIMRDYREKRPVFISVLKGTLYFMADLTRKIEFPVDIDFMSVGVYPGTTSETGVVRITKDLDRDISGRHVLMIEDIINTGLTIGYLYQNLQSRNPASLNICTLLNNPSLRLVDIPVAYSGFDVPDVPMIGYGLDKNDRFRNLPYIAVIGESE